MVVAPKVSPRAANQVLAFASKYAPDAAAGVIDFSGLRLFRGPHLEGLDSDAFEEVYADYAPDFAWALRPAAHENGVDAEFRIYLLPTVLAEGHLLPADVPVSRLRGEQWRAIR